MTPQELYQLGENAYNSERYEEALKYYMEAGPECVDAVSSIPFCYVNLATEASPDASNHAQDTEYLVRGQQKAVKLLDAAIRSSLYIYRNFPDYPYSCNIAAYNIANALNLQYSLISTGLTTAYNITNTETTVRQTVMTTKIGDKVVNREVLWEDIIGTETTSFVSLNSYDMSDYHILGPDEKTKRVKASMETIVTNAAQIADILECINREYDAHMVRASVACAMAEAENGDRSMLLPAEWFIARADELAKNSISDKAVYDNWHEFLNIIADDYRELASKYSALLRSYRKRGEKPYLARFYQDKEKAPAVESCTSYTETLNIKSAGDAGSNTLSDLSELFLTVFAQVSFMKIFPTILFASIIGLFCGGLFHVFSSDAGIFTKVFGIVWFILTIGLTFFRTISDADEFRTNNTFNIYMGIMLGTALLFSINFIVAIIAYIVLCILAKKYK